MNKKRKFLAGSLVAYGLLFSQASYVRAADITDLSVPVVSAVESVSEKAPTSFGGSLSQVISVGEKRINERLLSLDNLKTKISKSKLQDGQKQTLTSSVDSEVSALSDVLTKIKAGTSTASVKTLDTSIYTDYRIYGIFIPKIKLSMNTFIEENHIAKLNSDTFVKVQSRIDALKAKGTNVTTFQANLDSAKSLAGTLPPKLSDLEIKINDMKLADYPVVSKAVIKSVNATIKSVRADLIKISGLLKTK